MDKFGIFNLLNSFLTPSAPSQSQEKGQTEDSSSQPNDLVSGILGSLKNGFSQKEQAKSESSQPKRQSAPLQRQMLSTMSAHDELIRRINKKT